MTSMEFSTACIFRLGCKFPFISSTLRCTCSGTKKHNNMAGNSPLIGEYGDHIHVCNVGNERHTKHDSLVRTLGHLANYAGIKTRIEPTTCFSKSGSFKRPDLRLEQPSYNNQCRHDFVLDISVTHPATDAIITNSGTDKHMGRAAHVRELKKIRDYSKLAEQNDLHFMPIIFETYGRWGKYLTQYFEANVEAGWRKNAHGIPLSTVKEYWKKRISVNLQVMNARMFLYRVQRIISRGDTNKKTDESHFSDTIRECVVRREGCNGF